MHFSLYSKYLTFDEDIWVSNREMVTDKATQPVSYDITYIILYIRYPYYPFVKIPSYRNLCLINNNDSRSLCLTK